MTPTEINNLPILASAIDLISGVALEVLGGATATVTEGQKITPSTVRILAAAELNKVLSENSHD